MADQLPGGADGEELQSPLDICAKLEAVELDDDETESLLQEALALNKRLKAELQRRENPSREDDEDEGDNLRGNAISTLVGKQTRNTSPKQRRPGQKSNPLPPIAPSKGQSAGAGNPRKGAPVRSKGHPDRRGTSSPAPHATVGRIVNSAGSVEGSQRRAKSAKKEGDSRTSRSAEQRKKKPEWNDRFSYE